MPDASTPHEETLAAYDKLVKAGKVRVIGASNFDEKMLGDASAQSSANGLVCYETLQNEFNLYTRDTYEGPIQDYVVANGMTAIPYFSLASGFLTGKYRSTTDLGKSQRGGDIGKYLDEKGMKILAALDEVSAATGAELAEISLAWINSQPGIAAPIASATSVQQLKSLARGARLKLSDQHLKVLTDAGK